MSIPVPPDTEDVLRARLAYFGPERPRYWKAMQLDLELTSMAPNLLAIGTGVHLLALPSLAEAAG